MVEELVEQLVDERLVEVYGRLREEVRRSFYDLIDEYMSKGRGVDESTVKAIVNKEVTRLYSIVTKDILKLKAEFEERLSRLGVDETIRRMIEERFDKLLGEIKQLLDQRTMHLVDAINEVNNINKDVLDLISGLLRAEAEFEEELVKLRNEIRSVLSEDALEEHLYRALIKHGIIRRRKRKWAPIIAGLSVLAAVIAGFIINPIATLVILFIVFVILLRW